MGIFMFKFVHKTYTYGLNWNTLWDISDSDVVRSIRNIEKYTLPKIVNGENVYPDKVPIYILPIEPITNKLN